jgi:hypothetical protein
MKFVENLLIVVITTVRKNVIREAAVNATKHHNSKNPVLVGNTISKC